MAALAKIMSKERNMYIWMRGQYLFGYSDIVIVIVLYSNFSTSKIGVILYWLATIN